MDRICFVAESRLTSGNYLPGENPDAMVVFFKGGGNLRLQLKAFPRKDLENLVLALQAYVPSIPFVPPLAQVKIGISAENTAKESISFTQIWEDDMASRFRSTVFVPLEPGSKLKEGGLEVLGQIAFGGLSAVYLAKSQTQQLCVIKEAVVPSSADPACKEKAMELFQREAHILMTLKHTRIASVLDYFVENGRHYILLEYMDGKDLRKLVKEKGPQMETTVLRWAVDIAEVLDYLHKLNPPIVHRDLTPDNIVLVADGGVAVIDFGVANEFLGTATGTVVGKQSYISPEQFRGKATPASDLYSLGATLFFLLTGQDPEALSVSHPKEFNSSISGDIDLLVAELSSLDTENRIKSAEQVLEQCRALLLKMRQVAGS